MSAKQRFAVMAVPGDLEDGSDTYWFVLDTTDHASVETGSGEAGRRAAWRAVYEQNNGGA